MKLLITKNILLKYRAFYILIIILFCLSCTNIEVKSNFDENAKTELLRTTKRYQNIDKGYKDMINLVEGGDIYNTYYALEIQNLLNKKNQNINIEALLNNFGKREDEIFFNENNFGNLMNIYFYCKIADMYGIKIKSTSKFEDYLSYLQCSEGCFAFSKKDKVNIEDTKNNPNGTGTEFFSTSLASFVIKYLNIKNYDKEAIENWLIKKLDQGVLLKFEEVEQVGNLINVINMSDNFRIDISTYIPRINKIIKNTNIKFNSSIKTSTDFNSIYLNDIINLNLLVKNDLKKELDIEKIAEILNKTQNKDSWFGISEGSDSNILPTYIAINFYCSCGLNISHEDKILELLDIYRLNSNMGYASITNGKSDINTTYFIHEIYNILGEEEPNIGEYLNTIKNPTSLSYKEKIYYYSMDLDINGLKPEYKTICNTIEERLKNIAELYGVIDYIPLFEELAFLNNMNYEVDYSTRSKLIQIIKNVKEKILSMNDESIDSQYYAILDSLEIMLMKLLKYEDKDFYKIRLNNIQNYIKDELFKDEENIDLMITYYLIHCQNVSGIKQIDFSNRLIAVLNKCLIYDGSFKQSINSNITNFYGTYYALMVLRELNCF